MKKKPLILIIDDETAILQTLQEALEDEGYLAEILSDGNKALDAIGRFIPDLILLDIFMPHCNGLELLKKIIMQFPKQHIIIMSGFGTIQIALEAVKNGALDFIEKPLSLDEVLEKLAFLKKNVSRDAIQESPTNYDFETHGIVGRSYLFLELMNYIQTIAPLMLPTIIYGEPGTGKTLIARYIHKKSNPQNTLRIINCTYDLYLDQTLFEKNDTLFLKNIHLLTPENQIILLKNIGHKARIIASSTSDLFKKAQAGHFSMSLFAKLQALPIEIPALSKRKYDIPLLIDHFLNQANKNHNVATMLTPAAIRLLRNHNWHHKNVSELQAYLDNLVALADHPRKIFGVKDLHVILPERETAFVDEQIFSRFDSLDEATNTFQRSYLLHLLKRHHYDLGKLSTILSLNISQLRDKMVKLNINVG